MSQVWRSMALNAAGHDLTGQEGESLATCLSPTTT